MKRRRQTLLIAIAAAVTAVGGLTALQQHGHAQTAPSTAPTAAASTSPSSDFSRRFGRSDDERRSRGYGYGGATSGSAAYPIQKLTGTQYGALESRSIFARGYYRNQDGETPVASTQPTTHWEAPAPERTLVFEGATEFDDDFVAFVEDQGAMRVLMLKTGDAVGRGRVGPISLNNMDYIDKAGKTVHVAIGKNLEGGDPPATQPSYGSSYSSSGSSSSGSSPYSSPSPSSSSPGSSSASPSSPPPSSGGIMSAGDSMAEKMRRRRQAELGGGGGG